jgi:hypothetical protein
LASAAGLTKLSDAMIRQSPGSTRKNRSAVRGAPQ